MYLVLLAAYFGSLSSLIVYPYLLILNTFHMSVSHSTQLIDTLYLITIKTHLRCRCSRNSRTVNTVPCFTFSVKHVKAVNNYSRLVEINSLVMIRAFACPFVVIILLD